MTSAKRASNRSPNLRKPAITTAQWRRIKKRLRLTDDVMWECFNKSIEIRIKMK